MTVFDELAETAGDDEFKAWVSQLIDAKQEIVAFVASRLGQPAGEFTRYLKGSFNLCLVITFPDNSHPKVLIRFPKPGHTATHLRDEKVRNEVQVLKFLAEKTTIPVPQVLDWGTSEDGPCHLGPYMILNFIEGVSLATLLKQPTATDKDEVILADDVDEQKLDYLAEYLLQLSHLPFPAIGAISQIPSGAWTVTDRPLTYNTNELLTVVSSYPQTTLPTHPFTSTKSFLTPLAAEHLVHLRVQRNLAETRADACKRFLARHRFTRLVSRYCGDGGADNDASPFTLFCEDLQPTNMLADPATYRVTAVLDWEFANAMPAQFGEDAPWWLLLLGPDMWLERHSFAEFVERYRPRMGQFLRALERVEGRMGAGAKEEGGMRLSEKMRGSWESGRFWFDYGVRKSFDVDAVYWAALHKEGEEGEGDNGLSEEMRAEMEELVDLKMEQLKAYDEECRVRFSE